MQSRPMQFNAKQYKRVTDIFSDSKLQLTFKKLLLVEALPFPGGAVVKNPPANAGDKGLSPGPGRSHMPQSN